MIFSSSIRKTILPLALILSTVAITIFFLNYLGSPKAPKLTKSRGDSLYTASNSVFSVGIGNKSNQPQISFSRGNSAAQFVLSGSTSSEPKKVDGNTLTFAGVLPQTDLIYTTLPNGLKEEVILHSPPPTNTFVFDLTLNNAVSKNLTNNYYDHTFYDQNGSYLFHFEKPFAVDASGNRTNDVILTIARDQQQPDFYSLKLVVNETWLSDPARIYPITIDPTIVHDTTSEFAAGQLNRLKDTGSGSAPSLETYFQPLPTDQYTVALWHLDETAEDSCSGGLDACDKSATATHGTSGGSQIITSGQRLGSAARSFTGANGAVSLGTNSPLRQSSAITYEYWVNIPSGGGGSTIGAGASGGHGYGGIQTTLTSFTFTWTPTGPNADRNVTTSSINLVADTWNHIGFTINYEGKTYSLFVNGREIPLTLSSSITGSWSPVASYSSGQTDYFGGRYVNSISYFNGKLDEIRISNIARTPEEIKASSSRRPYSIYTSDVIDLTGVNSWNNFTWTELGVTTGDGETLKSSTNLIAQWNFNETSGTTADNAEGTAALDGTLTGFASTSSQDQAAGTGWTSANKRWGNGGLMFDGTNDYVTVSDHSSLSSTSKTVESWVKMTSLGTNDLISGKANEQWLSYGFTNAGCTSSRFNFAVYDGDWVCANSTIIPETGVWYHLVGTYDGTNIRLYVNGILQGGPVAQGNPSDGAFTFDIGSTATADTTYAIAAIIDSVRLYSRTLAPGEIMSNYQAGNIEFQTRVGSDASPDDGSWEAWKPTTGETAIDSFDLPSNGWKINSEPSSTTTLNKTNNLDVGDGADGDCIINNGTKTIDTTAGSSVCNSSGRSTAYAVNFSVTANTTAGSTSVTVSSTPTGLAAGDEFLIINLQGTSTKFSEVGLYETHTISSISTNTLNFTDYPLQNSYDGTTQKIMVQRVPNFGNVTVCGGNTGSGCTAAATVTTSAWNGTKNGVLFFRSNGTVTVNSGGTIDTNSLGYRGGTTDTNGGKGGEAYCSTGGNGSNSVGTPGSAGAGGGGGAGGSGANDPTGNAGGTGYCGGGGGGGRGGNSGSGSTYFGGAGGGGGGKDNGVGTAGAGGGGGYGSGGTGGGGYGANGGNGSSNSSGNGGSDGGGGGGGGSFGTANLSKLFMGTGGGEGSINSACTSGNGGNGGGIISIVATTITNSGTVRSNGQAGTNGSGSYCSPGGGGSGGSVNLQASSVTAGSSTVTATGGSGGTLYEQVGGNGGGGRIAVFYSSSLSGTTSPNSYTQKIPSSTVKIEGTGIMELQTGSTLFGTTTVGLWHMDETGGSSAYIKDSTSNANNGTPTGTTIVKGISNKARNFNGTSDYISITDNSTFDSNKTIDFWFYPDTGHSSAESGQFIMDTRTTNGTEIELRGSQSNSGKLLVASYSGGSSCLVYSTVATWDAKWYHVSAVLDDSNDLLRLYINGAQDNTVACSTLTSLGNPDGNLSIGSNNTPGGYFDGSIDEVMFSTISRSAEEIAEAYRLGRDHYINKTISSTDLSGKTTLPFYVAADRPGTYLQATVGESAFANYQPDSNTVGLWHLDEQSGSGAYIKDSSGNSNNATPNGTTYTQGKIGRARDFDGTTDYFNLGDVTVLEPTTLTINLWAKTDDYTRALNGGVAKGGLFGDATAYSYQLSFHSSNVAASFNDSTDTNRGSTSYAIGDNNWHMWTYTYDGTTAKLYKDGVLVSSAATTAAIDYTKTNNDFTIGARYEGSYSMDGQMDEISISSTARTATEIRQAYEVGLRSHPITIDFASAISHSDPLSSSGDLTFTLMATPSGTTNAGDNIYEGDKIIVKENYDGTEYIAQGTVDSVNVSTGATTVSSWDGGSTFPSVGFGPNSTVFKWQREYWPIDGEVLDSHLDAITTLTLRLTDGSEGRTIYLDDLKSNSAYLTTPTGSTITSSASNRYFQYRAILTSVDEAVSATFSALTVDYVSNSPPNTPSLTAPTDTATNQSLTPALQTSTTDADSDYIRYKIELCTNVGMTTGCQTFDQTSSQTGWSGQNTQTSTAYTSGTTATYTVQSALTASTTYYWRSYAIDPAGFNTWSSTQGTPYSFTTTTAPSAPSTPYAEGASNPTNVADLTPEFSAVHSDSDSDSAVYYEIEVNTNNTFTGTVMWDSGAVSMASLASGARSSDVSYGGTALSFGGSTYYWRIRFTDNKGATSDWSTTQNFTLSTAPTTPTLDTPSNGATNQIFLTELKTTATDVNSDYLRYKIELCTNVGMTTGCQTFDQTSSQTGWSGQNTQTSTAYTSGTQATYTIQSALTPGTTYYWRSYAIDPAGTNTWSGTQAPQSFSTLAAPLAATQCRIRESGTDTSTTIVWTDNATNEDYYEIQKSVDGGGYSTLATAIAASTTTYQDTSISSGNTYRYRIAPYFTTGPSYGDWCYTDTLTLETGNVFIDGLNFLGIKFN